MEPAHPTCDIWLWDGSQEYEGTVAKMADSSFTAHLREARRGAARSLTGRRFNTTFFDLQRQFVGHRFLAFCKLSPDPELQEALISSVQRSSAVDFDFFVCGAFVALDDQRREALRKMSARDVGPTIAERLGLF